MRVLLNLYYKFLNCENNLQFLLQEVMIDCQHCLESIFTVNWFFVCHFFKMLKAFYCWSINSFFGFWKAWDSCNFKSFTEIFSSFSRGGDCFESYFFSFLLDSFENVFALFSLSSKSFDFAFDRVVKHSQYDLTLDPNKIHFKSCIVWSLSQSISKLWYP